MHALYIAEFNALSEAIYTTDIDVTIPSTLAAGDRPRWSNSRGEPDSVRTILIARRERYRCRRGARVARSSIWTCSPRRRIPRFRCGSMGSLVSLSQGIPISASSSTTPGGPEIHATLDPPLKIRVPTLGAYVLVKALSSARRISLRKRAKDFVYLFAIIRDREMRREVLHEMPSRPDCFLHVHSPEAASWRSAGRSRVLTRRPVPHAAGVLLAAGLSRASVHDPRPHGWRWGGSPAGRGWAGPAGQRAGTTSAPPAPSPSRTSRAGSPRAAGCGSATPRCRGCCSSRSRPSARPAPR